MYNIDWISISFLEGCDAKYQKAFDGQDRATSLHGGGVSRQWEGPNEDSCTAIIVLSLQTGGGGGVNAGFNLC